MLRKLLLILCALLISFSSFARSVDVSNPEKIDIDMKGKLPKASRIVTYKKVDTKKAELKMNIYYPDNKKPEKPLPSIVFFAGGGWNNTATTQFSLTSRILADLGMIAIFADYRTG